MSEICKVCWRETVDGFYGAHGGGLCSAGANMGDEEACYRLGYDRERVSHEEAKVERDAWRAAANNFEHNMNLANAAREKAEERPFTKEDVAAVLNALDPFWTRAIAPEGETNAVVA